MRAILAVDQSTQSTKAVLFDEKMNVISSKAVNHAQFYPDDGWIEHDADEIFSNFIESARGAIEEIGENELCAVSISNQRETVVFWDKLTGVPCRRAIVWQDARAKDICAEIAAKGLGAEVFEASGMPLSPLFSAAKIRWALQNDSEVLALHREKRLCVGTVDAYLIYRLTGNFFCDMTNACRTQLFGIEKRDWDESLLSIFGVEKEILPEIKTSDSFFGMTDLGGILGEKVPVCGVAGDSQGAFFALGCVSEGLAKTSYGTGSSVMANVGGRPVLSKRLAATVGIAVKSGVHYALEGNISHSADVVSWMRGEMGLFGEPAETEKICESLGGNGGVYLVPAFTGLGAPWFAPDARAVICGLSRGSGRVHVIRAGIEAIAYQISDVLDAISGDAGVEIGRLSADGGASVNRFLMQFQADILNFQVHVAGAPNLSAVGAALLGGLGIGWYSDIETAAAVCSSWKEYTPKMPACEREKFVSGWRSAVGMVLSAYQK